jgi:hypothetical protein
MLSEFTSQLQKRRECCAMPCVWMSQNAIAMLIQKEQKGAKEQKRKEKSARKTCPMSKFKKRAP